MDPAKNRNSSSFPVKEFAHNAASLGVSSDLDDTRPYRSTRLPEEIADALKLEMRAERAKSRAITERADLKKVRGLAHGLVLGEVPVKRVLERLDDERAHLGAKRVDALFFKELSRLRQIWMTAPDRDKVKAIFQKRVDPDMKENMAPLLKPLRDKYGDEVVNYAVAEEMVLYEDSPCYRGAAYTTQRPDLDADIAELGWSSLMELARQAPRLSAQHVQDRLQAIKLAYPPTVVDNWYQLALVKMG